MNSLWPAATRISCLNTRSAFLTASKVDCLAARLARGCVRPYTLSSVPFRRREEGVFGGDIWRARCKGREINAWRGSVRRAHQSRKVITKYQELPDNYQDEDGLSYRSGPLTKKDAIEIFGRVVDVPLADRILRIVHGRRVAGTLEDPALSFDSQYEKKYSALALKWLRENVPVNEVESAGLRAEMELEELEGKMVKDAQRIGFYKREPANTPNTGYGENVYGRSVIEETRKANEKIYEAEVKAKEEKEKSQADEIRQNTGALEKLSARTKIEVRKPGEHPRLKYHLERAKVLPETPPEMSAFQRLYPSALMTLAVLLGCYAFTQFYTPPRTSSRLWPDIPPSAATIIGIILVNAVVFVAWHMPPMFRLLNMYFIVFPGYPRAASLLGSIFSHQFLPHFGMNMGLLYLIGTHLHDEVGRANFLAIYLATGTFGAFVSLTAYTLRGVFISSTLGASGSISGVIAAYLMLNSSERVTFFGVFPPESWPSISSLAFLLCLIGFEVLGMTRRFRKGLPVDHWAHLGGYAAGIGAAEGLKSRAKMRRQRELERRKNLGIVDRIKEGRV